MLLKDIADEIIHKTSAVSNVSINHGITITAKIQSKSETGPLSGSYRNIQRITQTLVASQRRKLVVKLDRLRSHLEEMILPGGYIELLLVPVSAPQLVQQRPWYVPPCL